MDRVAPAPDYLDPKLPAGLALVEAPLVVATAESLQGYGAFVREYLKIPDDRRLICGVSFGYEDRDHPANHFRTARAPLSEVVTWL